jgi:hypothetical protein
MRPMTIVAFTVLLGSAALSGASPATGQTIKAATYGPGIEGNVNEGPITPVCKVGVPCTRPFAGATVLILDSASRNVVASADTNTLGNFIVSVAPGSYLVHIMVVDFPLCPEVPLTVAGTKFSPVTVGCDTGIR